VHGLAVLGQDVAGVGAVGDLVPLAVVGNVQQLGCLAVKDDAKAIGRGVRLGAQEPQSTRTPSYSARKFCFSRAAVSCSRAWAAS